MGDSSMKEKKKLSLAVQIFIGLGLGIIAGLIFMAAGKADWAVSYVKPFGTIFLNLIKFIVVPIVLLLTSQEVSYSIVFSASPSWDFLIKSTFSAHFS